MTEEQRQRKLDYWKQYRKNHKEELREKKKIDYQKKRKQYLEQKKQYYQTQREHIFEYQKEYRENHREQIIKYQKQRRKTKYGRAYCLIHGYQTYDIKYNRGECTLTPQWMVDNIFSGQVCHWCGETDWTKLGCDRIDNCKPHTPDNVVPSCSNCNWKRKDASYEFYKMMHTPVTVKIWK